MEKNSFVREIEELSRNLRIDFVKKLHGFDSLDSTNRKAKELALAGAEEGTVVIAKVQTRGRGRFDRIWQSPEGGVYLSIILRPNVSAEKTSLLSFVAALAVTSTIESYGVHSTIKWPNDVRIKGKKVAGILLESEGKGQALNYIIIGVGMNLNVSVTQFSPDLQSHTTSMIAELNQPTEISDFLTKFLLQFNFYYILFKENRYESIVNQWKRQSDTIGKKILVRTASGTMDGIAFDVDSSGFLLLKSTSGDVQKNHER